MRIGYVAVIAVAGCGTRAPIDGACSLGSTGWTCATAADGAVVTRDAPPCPSDVETGSVPCLMTIPPNTTGTPFAGYALGGCFACGPGGVGTLWSCNCNSDSNCGPIAQNLFPDGTYSCTP
jgi:hypothetical protein